MIKKNDQGQWVEDLVVTRDQVAAKLDQLTKQAEALSVEIAEVQSDLAQIDAEVQ